MCSHKHELPIIIIQVALSVQWNLPTTVTRVTVAVINNRGELSIEDSKYLGTCLPLSPLGQGYSGCY